jgi:hypothetical protein
MTYYNLRVEDRTLSTPARDRGEALALFGKELRLNLTFDEPDTVAALYLMDEWEIGPHWVNPTIPVFAKPA